MVFRCFIVKTNTSFLNECKFNELNLHPFKLHKLLSPIASLCFPMQSPNVQRIYELTWGGPGVDLEITQLKNVYAGFRTSLLSCFRTSLLSCNFTTN